MRFLRFCSTFLLENVFVEMSGQSESLSKSSRRRLVTKREIVERVLTCGEAWDCLIGEVDLTVLLPGGGMFGSPKTCSVDDSEGILNIAHIAPVSAKA